MITGSALCLQGVALASFGTPLAPHVLRSIITATGIPSPDHARYIGPRPDLGAAVAAVLVWTSVPVANDLPPGIEIAPNPFRSGTVIRLAQDTRFAPGTSNPGRLRIVDAMGRTVRVFGAGEERIVWDGADGLGRQVGSGAYFLRFESLGSTQSARVLRVR